MEIKRFLSVCQTEEEIEELAIKNNTTISTCGYITSAICEYLSEEVEVTENTFKEVRIHNTTPYIEKVMKEIAKRRRMEIKKFMNKMNES